MREYARAHTHTQAPPRIASPRLQRPSDLIACQCRCKNAEQPLDPLARPVVVRQRRPPICLSSCAARSVCVYATWLRVRQTPQEEVARGSTTAPVNLTANLFIAQLKQVGATFASKGLQRSRKGALSAHEPASFFASPSRGGGGGRGGRGGRALSALNALSTAALVIGPSRARRAAPRELKPTGALTSSEAHQNWRGCLSASWRQRVQQEIH